MMLYFKNLLLFVSFAFLIPSFSFAQTFPYQKGNFLFFQGQGKTNPGLENLTQRRSLSKEAAILDGKAKISFYIHNLKMKNKQTIEQAMGKDSKIRKRVKAFLDGIQIVEQKWDENDNCTVILKVNRKNILRKLKAAE